MNVSQPKRPDGSLREEPAARPNGSGAAAILATGIGSFILGLLAVLGDKSASIKTSLVFYTPTGPLSGVTTVAIVVWIVLWIILHMRWRKRDVAMSRVNAAAFALLALALILTFPPIAEAL